jgi:hypothetical protein
LSSNLNAFERIFATFRIQQLKHQGVSFVQEDKELGKFADKEEADIP